ncbi:MAG: hypothetical protein ACKV19_18705 [Verrucomicrobiales bacterium]
MIDTLARDWKPVLLCFVLAVLVWFLVGERAGGPPARPLIEPAASLSPTLDQP